MTFRKAIYPLFCACACLVNQACVEYLPPPETAAGPPAESPPPPPQPPAYPAAYAEPVPQPPAEPAGPPAIIAGSLDELLAPIALYPDPLIAILLPASTVPNDVSAAAFYLSQNGDPRGIDAQPWDSSVRALAHYPTVLTWLANNAAWTRALGDAFSASPSEVMDAVQRLRKRALAAGTLASTPQQQVEVDDGEIEILPAQPAALYVPAYDPQVVYSVEPYYGYNGPFENFGPPCEAGIWLSYSFDWRSHRVWAGDRRSGDWDRAHHRGQPPGAHSWHPPAGGQRGAAAPLGQRPGAAPRPRPMPGAPSRPPSHYYKNPGYATDRSSGSAIAVRNPPASGVPAPQDRPRLNGPATPATSLQPERREPSLPSTNRGPDSPSRGYVPGIGPPASHAAPAPAPSRPSAPEPGREPKYKTPSSPERSVERPAQAAASDSKEK